MRPALYFRTGVSAKYLTPDTRHGFGIAAGIFFKYNQPFAVTCTSSNDHPHGIDIPEQTVFGVEKPDSAAPLIFQECRLQLGEDWKIEKKTTYWKFEHSPKKLEGKPR